MKKRFDIAVIALVAAASLCAQTTAAQTTPSAVQNKVAPAGGSVDVATATAPAVGRRRVPERVKGPTPTWRTAPWIFQAFGTAADPLATSPKACPKVR